MKKRICILLGGCIVGTLLGGLMFIALRYDKVTTVYVEGNIHYNKEEIMDMVMTGTLGNNSLYLALKYKTLVASMLFHLCFNAYSAFGTSILEKLEEMNALIYNIGVLVIGIVAFFLGIRLLKRDLRKEEKRFSGTGIGI